MKNYSIVVKQMIVSPSTPRQLITIDLEDGFSKNNAMESMSTLSKAFCETGRLYMTVERTPENPNPQSVVIDCSCGPVLMELVERP